MQRLALDKHYVAAVARLEQTAAAAKAVEQAVRDSGDAAPASFDLASVLVEVALRVVVPVEALELAVAAVVELAFQIVVVAAAAAAAEGNRRTEHAQAALVAAMYIPVDRDTAVAHTLVVRKVEVLLERR